MRAFLVLVALLAVVSLNLIASSVVRLVPVAAASPALLADGPSVPCGGGPFPC